MKLSIIVPVYKVEEYIDKCVDSILKQTFQDYELVLVDDGSPDSCGDICEQWKAKDPRIKVIHKENGGLSDARNAGIDIAQGMYIGFVDSDDYIDAKMFETLVENIEKYDADISMCGYANVYNDTVKKVSTDKRCFVWTQKEAIYNILCGRELSVHAYTKLYRKELFDDVRYTKGIISEDAYIIMDIMDKVQKAVFTPQSLYFYVHRPESINTCAFRKSDLTRIDGHYKNYIYVKERFPDLTRLAFERYLGANAFVANKAILSNTGLDQEEVKQCVKMLRENYGKIVSGTYFRLRRKILIGLLVIDRRIYRKVLLKVKKV